MRLATHNELRVIGGLIGGAVTVLLAGTVPCGVFPQVVLAVLRACLVGGCEEDAFLLDFQLGQLRVVDEDCIDSLVSLLSLRW